MAEQHSPPDSHEDTSTRNPAPLVEEGEWAWDAEQEDSNLVLVLEHTNIRSNQEVVDETPPADDDITVATYNKNYEYPPSEPVSYGVYRDTLADEFGDEWTVEDVLRAYANGVLSNNVKIYSHPRTRLQERE